MVTFPNREKCKIKAWRCPTLTWGNPTLPSALLRFTTEFDMGSGGSTMLWSPSKFLITFSFSKKLKVKLIIRKAVIKFLLVTRKLVTRNVYTHSICSYFESNQNPLGVVWLSLTGN